MKHKHHELMIAYANDISIEIQSRINIEDTWEDVEDPCFLPQFEYRRKPQKKYRPYTFEEAKKELKGVYIKYKGNEVVCIISSISEKGIKLSGTNFIRYSELLVYYETENCQRLGVLEYES